jgi:hypothetical protein
MRAASGQDGRGQPVLRGARHPVGIAQFGIALDEGLLGRLDQAVQMIKAFGLRHAQPVEQARIISDDTPCVGAVML